MMMFFYFSVSHKNYWMCSDELDERKNEKLKSIMTDYFHDQQLQMNEEVEEPVRFMFVL